MGTYLISATSTLVVRITYNDWCMYRGQTEKKEELSWDENVSKDGEVECRIRGVLTFYWV